MFMLIVQKGEVVAKQVTAPPFKAQNTPRKHRTRSQWMHTMNVKAHGWGQQRYAFKHSGEWHLCDVANYDRPLKSLPADTRAAVEMTLLRWASKGAM